MSTYRILLPLRKEDAHIDLVTLAGHLLPPEGGQIVLMGVVMVPEGHSLSEAALPAQEIREILANCAKNLPDLPLYVKPRVRVSHTPWLDVLSELQDDPADLLLLTWDRNCTTVLGASVEEVLSHTPCDLILTRGAVRRYDRVLLAIRGGPHLELMLRLSQALYQISGEKIDVVAVKSKSEPTPALKWLKEKMPFISRIVSLSGNPLKVIQRLATDYHALVVGTTLPESTATSTLGRVPAELLAQTELPIFLVRSFYPASKEIPEALPAAESAKPPSTLSDQVSRWFATNTFHWSEFRDVAQLIRAKEQQGVTISLVLPSLNEEATVGKVITTIKSALMEEYPLLDEIVLIDSGSTDRTREIAASLGIPVYIHQEVLAEEVGSYHGKGEALWKSLYVARGDIIAWIDTDIVNIHPRFVIGILGPLLNWNRIQYVKGFYQRPLRVGSKVEVSGGGRVTELLARPLINLFFPELSGIVQPLSGEYAGRRSALEQVPFFVGYGVEAGLLVDLLQQHGLQAIAQSNLEMRTHQHKGLTDLSKMAFAILQVFATRLEMRTPERSPADLSRTMKIIRSEPGRFCLEEEEITEHERPPMITIPAYRAKFHPEEA
ncbi:MAG: glucosyl-3-phosphoglycerate synthase [Anaerolineae bacterium]